MSQINLFHDEKDPAVFEAGATIFEADEKGDFMYVVIEGEIDISLKGQVLETVQAGGMFGEMALIDNLPRSATAVARTSCKLAKVDETRFMYLIQNTPSFAVQIMRIMSDRLRRQNQQAG